MSNLVHQPKTPGEHDCPMPTGPFADPRRRSFPRCLMLGTAFWAMLVGINVAVSLIFDHRLPRLGSEGFKYLALGVFVFGPVTGAVGYLILNLCAARIRPTWLD